MSWAAEELSGVSLGDERRNRRLVKIVEDLSAGVGKSIPQASRDEAAMQGMYDFWANRRVSAEAILAGHRASAIARISREGVVLAFQDTSELDYSDHRRRTSGLGSLSNPDARGLKLHTVLAFSDTGVPLGILHQQMWSRAGKVSKGHRQRQIEEKESRRWLESLEVTQRAIPETVQVITIADREADIYELFAHPRPGNSELLIRAAQNRNTKREAYSEEVEPLFDLIASCEIAGQKEIELQRTPRRRPRKARLTVRYGHVWLQPPAHLKHLEAIEMWAVLAEEEEAPAGESAVRWLLLSTTEIRDYEEACESLRRYGQRWTIDRYFYALQTGCRVEQLQLERGERLERAVATYSIVAWRLLWLMYEARRNPERSVEGILAPEEWRSLYLLSNQTKEVPLEVPTLGESVRRIAKLGGFLGRKGDGEAGIQTIWRGWTRLMDAIAVWELMERGD
jgi:hypothetical protein